MDATALLIGRKVMTVNIIAVEKIVRFNLNQSTLSFSYCGELKFCSMMWRASLYALYPGDQFMHLERNLVEYRGGDFQLLVICFFFLKNSCNWYQFMLISEIDYLSNEKMKVLSYESESRLVKSVTLYLHDFMSNIEILFR